MSSESERHGRICRHDGTLLVGLTDDYYCFEIKCVLFEEEPHCLDCAGKKYNELLLNEKYLIVHKLISDSTNVDEYYNYEKCCKCNANLIKHNVVPECDYCLNIFNKLFAKGVNDGKVTIVQDCW